MQLKFESRFAVYVQKKHYKPLSGGFEDGCHREDSNLARTAAVGQDGSRHPITHRYLYHLLKEKVKVLWVITCRESDCK